MPEKNRLDKVYERMLAHSGACQGGGVGAISLHCLMFSSLKLLVQ
jgi:hypothetical protein